MPIAMLLHADGVYETNAGKFIAVNEISDL